MKKTKEGMNDTDKKIRKNRNPNEESIDGVYPSDLMRYFNSKNLLVGKMIRYLYKMDKQITFEEFKNGVGYQGSDKQFMNNIDNGRNIHCQYGMLWSLTSNVVSINAKVKDHIRKNILT
jgi:hypothetical protein